MSLPVGKTNENYKGIQLIPPDYFADKDEKSIVSADQYLGFDAGQGVEDAV